MSALNLAFVLTAAFALVVLALVPRFRSLRDQPPSRPPWRVVAVIIGLVLAFQLINAAVDR